MLEEYLTARFHFVWTGYYSVVPSVRGDGSALVCQDAPLSDPSGGASMPDLDSVFGPAETPRSGSDVVQCSWVNFFSEGSPARPPPPDEPAPSPPLSSSPADSPLTSPCHLPPPATPPPPLHSIPPPDSPPPPPPSDSPLSPLDLPCCFQLPESEPTQESPVTPTSPGLPFLPADHPPHGAIPSPLALRDDSRRTPDLVGMRDEISVFGTSPKDLAAGSFRGTPPPLPPPTYRSVVGSPGPGSRELAFVTLKDSSSKKLFSVIIYSPSSCSKAVWISFFCWT